MASEAIAFITAHKDAPFYVNYWAFSVHAPYDAKKPLVEKYRAKAATLPPGAGQRNPVYAAMVESIDDSVGRTLSAASTLDKSIEKASSNVESAQKVGKLIAERAKGSNISNVVFDRGGHLYHGKVKALADAAREGGLQF